MSVLSNIIIQNTIPEKNIAVKMNGNLICIFYDNKIIKYDTSSNLVVNTTTLPSSSRNYYEVKGTNYIRGESLIFELDPNTCDVVKTFQPFDDLIPSGVINYNSEIKIVYTKNSNILEENKVVLVNPNDSSQVDITSIVRGFGLDPTYKNTKGKIFFLPFIEPYLFYSSVIQKETMIYKDKLRYRIINKKNMLKDYKNNVVYGYSDLTNNTFVDDKIIYRLSENRYLTKKGKVQNGTNQTNIVPKVYQNYKIDISEVVNFKEEGSNLYLITEGKIVSNNILVSEYCFWNINKTTNTVIEMYPIPKTNFYPDFIEDFYYNPTNKKLLALKYNIKLKQLHVYIIDFSTKEIKISVLPVSMGKNVVLSFSKFINENELILQIRETVNEVYKNFVYHLKNIQNGIRTDINVEDLNLKQKHDYQTIIINNRNVIYKNIPILNEIESNTTITLSGRQEKVAYALLERNLVSYFKIDGRIIKNDSDPYSKLYIKIE